MISTPIRMIDVGEKAITERVASARSVVSLRPETLRKIQNNEIQKGDVFAVARIAGIQAAKETFRILPLCHPISLEGIEIDFIAREIPCEIEILITTKASSKTGVEMEAMTAASVAALTIYDMCKSVDRGLKIQTVELLEKRGGKSGTWKK